MSKENLQKHAETVLQKTVTIRSIVPCMIKRAAYWERMREIEYSIKEFEWIGGMKGEDINDVIDWAKQEFMKRSNINKIIP